MNDYQESEPSSNAPQTSSSSAWQAQQAKAKPTDIFEVDAGPLASKISEWADIVLRSYLDRHAQSPVKDPKIIHDPIGKALRLMPWEVYILDSPLLQRLRGIRQLGVGHVLFPTAGYSRFEHSVGCVHSASVLFDTILETLQLEPNSPVHYHGETLVARRDLVRLAALLHDIGHCILSHVSERFYETDSEVALARKRLQAFYKKDVAAAEVLAILILRSPAFSELLSKSAIRRTVYQDRELIDKVCSCIAGSKYRMIPDSFMAEIVNGPVDCDKMDYLARDAHMAGVPISLDIERLCSKLRVIRTESKDQKTIYSLAIVPSGARALEEMLVSRIFLYDKFYYHPKVMAAEELVRRALYYLSQANSDFRNPRTLLDYGDDEFLSLSPRYLADRYGMDPNDPNLVRGCEMLSRAKNRDLPKRAFAFARRFIPELPDILSRLVSEGNPDNKPAAVEEYILLDRDLKEASGTHREAEHIQERIKELGVLDAEVFVAHQSAERAAGKMDIPVKVSDTENQSTPDFLFNVSKWSDAYAQHKQTSYVYGYSSLPQIHLAAERVFAERGVGMDFAPKCWVFAKLTAELVNGARQSLPVNDRWLPSRLQPDYLRTVAGARRIVAMQAKFNTILTSFSKALGPALVENWLWQFPDADLQDTALRLLEHITVLEKEDILRGFRVVATRAPELETALWIPLRPYTSEGASADLIRYDLKSIARQTVDIWAARPEDIRAARRIVFFDDLLNTGTQVECLLSSWFLGPAGPCVHEADRDKRGLLDAEKIEALRSVTVDFVFYSSHPSGKARLLEQGKRIGLKVGDVYEAIDSSEDKYTLAGLTAATQKSRQRFIDWMQKKGEALLLDKHPGWDAAVIKEYALGYGGLQSTLVYRHSVSTALPIALWHSTDAVKRAWLPLFPRDEERLRNLLDPDGDLKESPDSDVLPEYLADDDDSTSSS